MVFQYPLPTGGTYVSMGQYLNTVSGDWFGTLIIMSVFVIMFISFRNWDLRVNLLTCSWMCFVLSTLTWLMGWSSFTLTLIFVLATAILLIWKPGPEYD